VWYWGGRYIPWLARLIFFFWAGAFAASRLFGLSSMLALLTGAVVVIAVISAGEADLFRSRREAVLRREADPRQFDALKSGDADAMESAVVALGFTRRGDCASTKGTAIVRRRMFVHRQQRSIVAALFQPCTLVPAEKGNAQRPPEERSAGPTSLSLISYGMNGSVIRSRSTAPGEKPMRPIPREFVQDFPSAPAAELFSVHARRLADIETNDRTRMIEVDEWKAFALCDALDDAWARRIESFRWTPMAYRMLVADYRWFRELPFLGQAAVVAAIILFGPGLLYFGSSAFANRSYQTHQVRFVAAAAGKNFDIANPPLYPGAQLIPSDESSSNPGARPGSSTSYVAPAPMETVRRWYEDRMPSDAVETMAQAGDQQYYTFVILRSDAGARVIISQDSPTASEIDLSIRQ
jgi:hypothetical protein